MPRPDLADIAELVDAAVEVGTKHRPIPRVARRRPRRRRTAGMVILVAAVGVMVLAYRWWRARERATAEAELVDLADRAEGAPAPLPPAVFPAAQPAPAPQPAASIVESPVRDTAPVDSKPEAAQEHGVTARAAEPPPAPANDTLASDAEASVSSETPAPELSAEISETSATDQPQASAQREQRETSSRAASGVWTPSTQPRRPQGVATPAHPRWGFGRGPSSGAPVMPSVRPTIPSRPRPHLPR